MSLCRVCILFSCAEDNLVNQKVMLKLLSREGHTAVMTDDGLQAVKQFEMHSPDYFDLVLLDMCMPVMDGVTACQRIREMEQQRRAPYSATYSLAAGPSSPPVAASPPVESRVSLALVSPLIASSPVASSSTSGALSASPTCPRIPIVAVTASALLEDKQVCVQAGMDDVIVKPLTPAALRAALKPIRIRINQSAAAAPPPPPLMFPVSALQAMMQAGQTQAAAAHPDQQASQASAPDLVPSAAAVVPASAPAPVAASPAIPVPASPAAAGSSATEPRPTAPRRPGVLRAASADTVINPRGAQQLTPRLPRAASATSASAQFPAPPSVAPVQPLLPAPPPPPAFSPPHASPPAPHLLALLSSALVNTPTDAAGTEK